VVDAATYFTSLTLGSALPVASGGTGLTAGTSGGVLAFTATGTLASSAALAASALVIGGGAGAAPSTTTTGTGVVTALGVNVGTAGAFVVNGGALGTPSSGTVTNLTGTASININGTVGATTASSGAFTTVTATGSGTLTNLLFTGGTLPGAGTPSIALRSSDNVIYHQSGSANQIAFLDSAQNSMASLTPTSLTFNISNVNKLTLNSTGLQVVNTLSGGTSGTAYSFSGSAPAGSLTLDSSGILTIGISSGYRSPAGYGIQAINGTSGSLIDLYVNGTRLGGVATTTGGTYLSSVTAIPLIFATTDIERMRLDSSGNLGIGTTSPGQKLDVNGGVVSRDGAFTLSIGTAQKGIFCPYSSLLGSGFDYTPTVFAETGLGITFAVNGATTKVMNLDTSGNLGIGTTSPAQTLHLKSETSANVQFEDTTSGTAGYVGPSVNNQSDTTAQRLGIRGEAGVSFSVGAATKMTLDSSGRLGIGTATPDTSTLLTVAGAVTITGQNTGHGASRLKLGQDTSAVSQIRFYGVDAATAGILQFTGNSSDGSVGGERMRLDSSGNLLVGVNTANANGGVLQLKSGITFPATAVAATDANTLDDYEEGTWTPTVIGTTTAGTASYSYNSGSYTKIGNLVTISFYIAWSSGTGTGDLRIAGLPFTTANSNDIGALALGYVSNLTLTALNYATSRVAVNSTQIIFEQSPVGGGSVATIAYDATAELVVSGSYFV
jgi:hypothetical protein